MPTVTNLFSRVFGRSMPVGTIRTFQIPDSKSRDSWYQEAGIPGSFSGMKTFLISLVWNLEFAIQESPWLSLEKSLPGGILCAVLLEAVHLVDEFPERPLERFEPLLIGRNFDHPAGNAAWQAREVRQGLRVGADYHPGVIGTDDVFGRCGHGF